MKMYQKIALILSFLIVSSVYAGGSSFGGSFAGGFTGSLLGNAMTAPRQQPVVYQQPAEVRYIKVPETRYVERPRSNKRKRDECDYEEEHRPMKKQRPMQSAQAYEQQKATDIKMRELELREQEAKNEAKRLEIEAKKVELESQKLKSQKP